MYAPEKVFSQEIINRCLVAAGFLTMHKGSEGTIRKAAKFMKVSKSTVYRDMTIRLPQIDRRLAEEVEEKLKENKRTGYKWGGQTTKERWKKIRKERLGLRLRTDKIFERDFYKKSYDKIELLCSERYHEIVAFGQIRYSSLVDEACRLLEPQRMKYRIIARLIGFVQYLGYGHDFLADLAGDAIAEKVMNFIKPEEQDSVSFARDIMSSDDGRIIYGSLLMGGLCVISKSLNIQAAKDNNVKRSYREYLAYVRAYYDYYLKNCFFKKTYINLLADLKGRLRIASFEVEELNYLCSVFGMTWGKKDNNIIIYSDYDKWAIFSDHKGMVLKHQNKKNITNESGFFSDYHIQEKYKGSRATFAHVFQTIYQHDRFEEKGRTIIQL